MCDILLVDDDEDDARFIKDALSIFEKKHTLVWLENGAELIEYLGHHPKPHVIILDLNMPIMDGKEALSIIKADPDLQTIPVVIFTTNINAIDSNECINKGANGCFIKPDRFEEYGNIIKKIIEVHFKG
jgi:CheY-like chemotaxis protein